MAKEYAKAFYKSRQWESCRDLYIRSRDGLCEDCLAKGIYKPRKVVHHIVSLTPENINNPAITLSFDNLRLVCQDCHAAQHAKGPTRRYSFDAAGNIILREGTE